MHRSIPPLQARRRAGTVHCVDTVNRELTVSVNGELLTFDVPVGCPIRLHGERVRFRLVQPYDRVNVTFAERGNVLAALAIDVQPEETPSVERNVPPRDDCNRPRFR